MATAQKLSNVETGNVEAGPLVQVGLIGKGIQRSRTPAMHVAEGQELGLDYRYDLIDPEQMSGPEPSISDLLTQAEADGCAGVNVTYPYKKASLAHLDEVSDAAARIGAVNTVVFRDGRRFGHNTDFWGFAESMRRGMSDADMGTVLLLGAGGAGCAVAHALVSLGAGKVLICDQSTAAAESLAQEIDGEVVTDITTAASCADGIVNATPMGMAKLPGSAISPELLETRHWAVDIVYFPMETEFLRDARLRGCRTLDGGGMAVFQAVRAFELFTGQQPDAQRMQVTFEAFSH